MANPYQLQIALAYLDDIRECLVKLEEMDLQDVISESLDECQKWSDQMKVELEAAEPDLDEANADAG